CSSRDSFRGPFPSRSFRPCPLSILQGWTFRYSDMLFLFEFTDSLDEDRVHADVSTRLELDDLPLEQLLHDDLGLVVVHSSEVLEVTSSEGSSTHHAQRQEHSVLVLAEIVQAERVLL